MRMTTCVTLKFLTVQHGRNKSIFWNKEKRNEKILHVIEFKNMITIQKLKNYKLHTALRQLLPNFVNIFLIDLKKKI